MIEPYYRDEWTTLYHGDALDVLPSLPDASAGAVILDPPYSFESISVRGRDDGAAGTSGAPVMLFHRCLVETRRLLADGGISPILFQWRRFADVQYLASLAGLRLSACVIWDRERIGTGGLFRSTWDPILVASKGSPTLRDKAAVPNLLRIPPVTGGDHPYEKPPALWTPFLARIPRGVLVVDPFAGLGAAGLAARREGHRFIGIEADERYCEVAAQRLSQDVLGLPA